MTTVQLKSEINIELDQLLDGVAQLDTPNLERVLEQLSVLLAQRRAPNLSARESELLQAIGRTLPEATQARYEALQAKSRQGVLAEGEHQELISLIDAVESADAVRLQSLIELAQLRNIPLDALLETLHIQPPPPDVR